MASNLLAHAPDLFACAVARSGAYNRTLTPFGFQSEERTLWQAPETYMKMSPFMHAHEIKKPILLIHGEEDTNSGTNVIQSERFFAALKGNGADARLVLLPHESHSTRALSPHWIRGPAQWGWQSTCSPPTSLDPLCFRWTKSRVHRRREASQRSKTLRARCWS